MGAVHEAEDAVSGRRVAIKIINRDLILGISSDKLRRFRREAKAAAKVDCPNIVQIFDSGQDEETGELFIVMELLEGEDLQRLMERVSVLSPDTALRIAGQALIGLVAAHGASVIHRDIKPANIFIATGEDGLITVKLLDFGIAKFKTETNEAPQSTALTTTGNFLGSPLYVSPEQVDSSKDVDEQTDVWSLGATLYCALTGQAPHQGITAIVRLIFAICSLPAPSLVERAPWIPPEIAAIAHRALEIEREDRYPSAKAMLEAIRKILPGDFTIHEENLVSMPESARVAYRPPLGVAFQTTESAETIEDTVEVAAGPTTTQAIAESNPQKEPTQQTRAETALEAKKADAPRTTLVKRSFVGLVVITLFAWGTSQWLARSPSARNDGTTELPAYAAPTQSASSQPLENDQHTLSVAISPETASVFVDGISTTVQSGAISISGKLGSVHHVRVLQGNSEITVEVVLAENGALPGSIALPKPPPLGSSTHPSPAIPTTLAQTRSATTAEPTVEPTKPVGSSLPPPPTKTAPKPEDVLMPNE